MVDLSSITGNLKDVLSSLVLQFDHFLYESLIIIPVSLLVGHTAINFDLLTCMTEDLEGIATNELKELKEVLFIHHARLVWLENAGNELILVKTLEDFFFINGRFGNFVSNTAA